MPGVVRIVERGAETREGREPERIHGSPGSGACSAGLPVGNTKRVSENRVREEPTHEKSEKYQLDAALMESMVTSMLG
jgi:hypothetical protein